jgi:phosphatidylserine/phosphatidylglycerophosphate/cardiolipin synthase-like enzyme
MRSVPYVGNNDVKLLESGGDYFKELLAAIDGAKHEVLYETYIYAEDEVARAVTEALQRAARRDVKVRVLVDWFGTGRQAPGRGVRQGLRALPHVQSLVQARRGAQPPQDLRRRRRDRLRGRHQHQRRFAVRLRAL